MKATVELIYDGRPSRPLEVEIRDGLKGTRFLNAIAKAVEKAAAADKEWKRWNLITVS